MLKIRDLPPPNLQFITPKFILISNIVLNLGILGVFKYYNFFVENFVSAFASIGVHLQTTSLRIILPVGISFYTFQALSYSIDVYKKKIEPTVDIVSFFAFVSFFPQLVAGPIERATNLLPQFYVKRIFNYEKAIDGMRQILWGLFKKIVIADRLSILVNTVYNNPTNSDGMQLIVATIFFSIQIYCDFSGYSDIAIGIGKLFGINLMTNFNFPYLSKSITEFWQRWHISLSTWFKDYLYIPLGGNRVSKIRNIFNLFIVFVISGFWHGANYTFLIWGAIHGFVLVIEKLVYKRAKLNVNNQRLSISNILRILTTYLIVAFAWIFFRANNLTDAVYIVRHIFDFNLDSFSFFYESGAAMRLFNMTTFDFYLSIFFIFVLLTAEIASRRTSIVNTIKSYPVLIRWNFYVLFTIIILWFGKYGLNQFIYFQF